MRPTKLWGIAIALVVLVGLGMLLRNLRNRVSQPTTLSSAPATLGRIELPISPRESLTLDDALDAAGIYRSAIALNDPTDEQCAKALVEAVQSGRMSLFASDPTQVIHYRPQKQIESLRTVGNGALRAGVRQANAGKPDDAKKTFLATFVMGLHLFEERIVFAEMQLGMEMMSASSAALMNLADKNGKPDEAKRWRQFDDARRGYVDMHVIPVYRALSSIDPNVARQHAGDAFAIAENSQEKMWRVEALLKLGRMRYSAATRADERGAERVLQQYANDPDPAIKAAANAGLNLTVEEFRMQR